MTSVITVIVLALTVLGVVYFLNKRSNNSNSTPSTTNSNSGGSSQDGTIDSNRSNQELL